MSLIEERDEAVESVRQELQRLIRLSGETQRILEEKNGFTRGYLSQVLQGHITLTVRHVLGILLALGVPPARFFWQLFEAGGERGDTYAEMSEIRQRMARYDAVFDELERKGLIDLSSEDPPPPAR